jgi:exodeoxyribonuclease V gamma subunit
MLSVHHAARAEALVDVLAEVLSHPLADPFTTEVVAVPSRGVERWVAQQLARRLGTTAAVMGGASAGAVRADGVAADIAFPFPGRLLRPQLVGGGASVVGSAVITAAGRSDDPWQPGSSAWHVLDAGRRLVDPAFSFARAVHVARLFDRYAVYRPALLHQWRAGFDVHADGRSLEADHRWQPLLWRAVEASLRPIADDPAARLRLAVEHLAVDPASADLPERLSIVAFGALPASSLVVLDALAMHREVHVLLLHPSPGWWATVGATAPSEVPPPHPRVDVVADHPLLRTWGQVAYETQLALRAGTDGGARPASFHAADLASPDHGPATLLERLQLDLHLGRSPHTSPPLHRQLDDRSVQVHACHGLTRQVEVLRDALAHLLADPVAGLQPSDVLVLCTDLDRARPLVTSTLGLLPEGSAGSTPRVMLSVVGGTGSGAHGDEPLVDALFAVLRVAVSRVTATAVAGLAGLGPVRARLALSDDDLARLDSWIEHSHVRWGLDGEQVLDAGLPDELETTSWEAALDRLLLGSAMPADHPGLALGGRRALTTLALDDAPGIGRLAELVHRLRTVRPLLRARHTASQWSEVLHDVADGFLAADPDQPWQARRLARLLDALDEQRFAGFGPASSAPDGPVGPVDPELGLDDVVVALRTAWDDIAASGPTASGGITVCGLGDLRGVPFQVVCLLGLDDVALRAARTHPDDLLGRAPCIGDRDPRSEQRALLLDAVLAARRHLVITHDGHDVRTNQPLPPAVPLAELLDVIDHSVHHAPGEPTPVQRVVQQHPRQGFADRCLTPGALGVPGPWSFDRDALDGALARRAGLRPPAELRDLLLPAPASVTGPTAGTTLERPNGVVLLADLRAALCDPTAEFLQRGLGISLPREAEERSDLVPTALSPLARWQAIQQLLDLRADPDVDRAEAERRWRELLQADGLLPAGRFADAPVQLAITSVDVVHEQLRLAGLPVRAADSIDVDLDLAENDVTQGARRLVGTVADVHHGTNGTLVVVRTRAGDVRAKDLLAARLDLLALAALGHRAELVFVGVRLAKAVVVRASAPTDADAARRCVIALVRLSERMSRSALPVPVSLAASWAGALERDGRPTVKPVDAWGSDTFSPAVTAVWGDLDPDSMAARRTLDDDTPAPVLADRLWRLVRGDVT